MSNESFIRCLIYFSISMAVLFSPATAVHAQSVQLRKGMKITSSVKIKKGQYRISAPDTAAAIIIEGNNITVDFNGAVLIGHTGTQLPDQFSGRGITIKGKNITIKNLHARGYKVALLAWYTDGLKIENCDFSYNYRQRLNSTQEKENISDWMSYHRNEDDEWLRYGAAMYLRGCNNAVVSNTKVTGGQNALMMMECHNAMIFNNDFSFNSGIGIGMYKSSHNKILYNKINFNVRGYSHGVYNRGQDSAGILVYEQSSHNLFYRNAATHSGDGFFLWAGQSTMDSGKGGCNDNLLLRNDFSYAPTNGIEVTFSRNKIIHNRIYECDHGIWGGYSYETEISDNHFRDNRIAIAIEHGQYNTINHNLFLRDKEGIRLWARKQQPSDWGYAKYRDTRSTGNLIALNSFNENLLGVHLSMTDSTRLYDNAFTSVAVPLQIDSAVYNLDSLAIEEELYRLSEERRYQIPEIKKPNDPFRGSGRLAGRKNILMTEWGPYDFQYPIIWYSNPADTSDEMQLHFKGPAGKWKIISAKGVTHLSKKSGVFSDTVTAKKMGKGKTDILIVAEYTGAGFTDPFGNKVAAKRPYRFVFKKFFQPIDFTVSWYQFDSGRNPIHTDYLEHIKTQRPFKTDQVSKLDYAWWGGIKAGDHRVTEFLTIAEGAAELSPGAYDLGITWDDAVRVYLDGRLIVDEWNPAQYKFDESPHRKVRVQLGGNHIFRVEHVELGGFATLSLNIKPAD